MNVKHRISITRVSVCSVRQSYTFHIRINCCRATVEYSQPTKPINHWQVRQSHKISRNSPCGPVWRSPPPIWWRYSNDKFVLVYLRPRIQVIYGVIHLCRPTLGIEDTLVTKLIRNWRIGVELCSGKVMGFMKIHLRSKHPMANGSISLSRLWNSIYWLIIIFLRFRSIHISITRIHLWLMLFVGLGMRYRDRPVFRSINIVFCLLVVQI